MGGSSVWATLSDLCSELVAHPGLEGQGRPLWPLVSWLVHEGLTWTVCLCSACCSFSRRLARACPRGSRAPRKQEQKPPGLETRGQSLHSHFYRILSVQAAHRSSPDKSRWRNQLHCLMRGAAKEAWLSATYHKHRILG